MDLTEMTAALAAGDSLEIHKHLVALTRLILLSLSRDDWQTGGRHLGLLHRKELVFEHKAQQLMLGDYLLYSYRPRGFNSAELYLRTHRGELDTGSQVLLERMSAAF